MEFFYLYVFETIILRVNMFFYNIFELFKNLIFYVIE